MKINSRYIGIVLMTLLLAFLLGGCGSSGGGGGDDGSPSASTPQSATPADTVSGVAATGAAITGSVYLKDSAGTVLGPEPIAADGSFSFDVTGLTAPFYLCAEDTSGNKLYSVAMGPGTANINPLTNLAVAAAAGVNDPADVYNDPSTYPIDANELTQVLNDIQNMLSSLLQGYGAAGVNPLTDPFTADGTGLDGFFDDVSIDIDTVTGVVTFTASTSIEIDVSGRGEINLNATMDVDVNSSSLGTGTLEYFNALDRVHLISSSITDVQVTLGGIIVEGTGDVIKDNVTISNCTFTATIVDSSPDEMGIEIRDPGNALVYDAPTQAITGGIGYTVVIQ